jgi:hypothetical protein
MCLTFGYFRQPTRILDPIEPPVLRCHLSPMARGVLIILFGHFDQVVCWADCRGTARSNTSPLHLRLQLVPGDSVQELVWEVLLYG